MAFAFKSFSLWSPSLHPPGVDMISKMLKMQMLEDEDDLAYAEAEKKARADSTADGRPAWMRTLHTTASNWLQLIPQTLSHLKRTVENIKVPAAGGAAPWRPRPSLPPAGLCAQVPAGGGNPVKLARNTLEGCLSAYTRSAIPGPSPQQGATQLRPRPRVKPRAPPRGPGMDEPPSHWRRGLSLMLPFTPAFSCL